MPNYRPRLRTFAAASAIAALLFIAAERAVPPYKVTTAHAATAKQLGPLRAADTPRAMPGADSNYSGRTSPGRLRSLRMPLAFEPTAGASPTPGGFVARGSGYTVLVTGDEVALSLRSQKPGVRSQFERRPWPAVRGPLQETTDDELRIGLLSSAFLSPQRFSYPPVGPTLASAPDRAGGSLLAGTSPGPAASSFVRLRLVGANPKPKIVGLDKLSGKSNYFIGRDPKKWRSNVPNYARVMVKDVYPGIDVAYHAKESGARSQESGENLEFDFVVHPGADLRNIRLAAEREGQSAVSVQSPVAERAGDSLIENRQSKIGIDPDGDLVLGREGDAVRFHKPVVYQAASAASESRRMIEGRYTLGKTRPNPAGAGYEVGFEVGPYDRGKTLVIDPVLVYSSYLGGSGNEFNGGLAVDSAGNLLVSGGSYSADFPTTSGAFQPSFECSTAPATACYRGFVTKFDPSGATLIYSTFLGGTASDSAGSLTVDSAGNTFIAGGGNSTDFPLVNPTPTNYKGGTCDGFVAELSAAGDQLLYSTCFAGSQVSSIAVDSTGDVYLAGTTSAANFPVTTGAFQTTYNGNGELFVSKLRPDGSPLLSSTFLGGTDSVGGGALAVDGTGSPYVAGFTTGTTFPTTPGAFDTTPGPGCQTVLAKLKPDFSGLAYSTYLCADSGYSFPAVAVDSSGSAYVAGSVSQPIFPVTSGAFQTTYGGDLDGFVAKFDPLGSTLVYGTYIGGSATDYGSTVAVDASGQGYITGRSESQDFPTLNPLGPPRTCCQAGGAFVTVLNSSGSGLIFSTFLDGFESNSGSNRGSAAYGIALTPSGNVAIFGYTDEVNFPLVKPFQNFYGGNSDTFLAIISPIAAPGATLLPTAVSFPNQNVGTTSGAQFATLMNVGSLPLAITSIAATGDFTESNTCPSTIAVGGNCSVKLTFSPSGPGALTGFLMVTDNALDSPQSFTLSGIALGAAASATPATIAFPNQFVGTTGLPQDVTLTNAGTVPLAITAVQATGDFGAVNGCTSSVAPGVNCTIGVFFDPSATGDRTGTLTVTDNAPGSPQTVALSGTGEDFSMAPTTTTLVTPAGVEVTDPVTLNPAGGFNVPVVLTCSGAPSLSTCTVNPSSAAMNGTSPVTVTVTIQTTASSSAPGRLQLPLDPRGGERLFVLGLLLLCLTLAAGKRRRALLIRLSLVSLLFLAAFWSGCGGSAAPLGPHTPAGTYTLAVTGIAANGPATLSHTVPLTLTVQ